MKKLTSIILLITMLFSLTVCNKKQTEQATTTNADGIVKPEKISVMMPNVNGAGTENEYALKSFKEQLSKVLGIEIDINVVKPKNYYDVLENAFANDEVPDVLISNPNNISQFMVNGGLYDITDLWDSSELKKNCTTYNVLDKVEGQKIIDTKTGEKRLYTIPLSYGSTKLIYVRKSWLDECNLSVPKTYEEYYNMLLEFRDKYNTKPMLRASSDYSLETFPEFYQDSHPYIYQKEDGKWADGFIEEATKEALLRLQKAYNDGLIDSPRSGTTYCMEISSNPNGVVKIYPQTSSVLLRYNAFDIDELVILEPLKEMNGYVDSGFTSIAITSKCKNPEGVFKYFIEPMFDRGAVQALCTYGVKGVHWDTKAETIKVFNDDYTYNEGEFHYLPIEGKLYSYIIMNPEEQYIPFEDEYNYKCDNLPSIIINEPEYDKIKADSMEVFKKNCYQSAIVGTTINADEIISYRTELIKRIVERNLSIEDAIKEYKETVGDKVEKLLQQLNN